MQINSVINSIKPNQNVFFKERMDSEKKTKKIYYKHYEQMDDDVLKFRSILKANKDTQESPKMKIFKAMPDITTALMGASIALSQPGKMATKAGVGLSFLALSKGLSTAFNSFLDKKNNKKDVNPDNNSKTKNVLKTSAKILGAFAAGSLFAVGYKKTNGFKKVAKFIANEGKQLASEINNYKPVKALEGVLNKVSNKFPKATSFAKKFATPSILVGSVVAQMGLANSLSSDIKQKATDNYAKGKKIQQQAKAHFDSIEAEEI